MDEADWHEREQGPDESFFHQLFRDRSHIEINVSRAFAMCFRESLPFANAVLELLHSTCGERSLLKSPQWECRTEVSFSKGRPDIEIHAPGVALFRLENKIGAPLTKNQLRRYGLRGRHRYLIALTKRPPDVGRRWISRQGAFSIRWQDVHRAVAKAPAAGKDRYLRDSFCLFLEELGMAHREDISLQDLDLLYELLDTIAINRRWRRVSPRNAFDVGDATLHLLREVAREARDDVPALESWSRSGPFYSKNEERGWHYHHLGFFFQRKRGKEKIGAGFSFRQNGGWARWEVWRTQSNQGFARTRLSYIRRVCGKTGALDRNKMLKSFVNGAKALGLRG